ncbi:MAG: glycosyltransferase family 2 protein [Porphyrobacter sp.]|nr:glycosyltransferase family 2 protein [Porphyrobacter sp.]
MTRPKVTIVIPAYNMERYIERTLLSAIAQTYENLSILVIDDGSTDGTRAIVERLAREHDKLRLVSVPNGGVAKARNLGTQLADSLYVACLDGDDLWHPTKIQRQVAALAAHGHSAEWAGCYAYSRVIDENDRLLGDGLPSQDRGAFFEAHMTSNPIGNGSNLLVRRDAALAVDGYNPEYAAAGIGGCEDVEFQLKLLRRHKIEVVPEYLIGYRIHSRQMSGNIARMRASQIAVIDKTTRDPEVSRGVRKRGLVHAHLTASKAMLAVGKWHKATQYLWQSLRLSPVQSARQLATITGNELAYWTQHAAGALLRAARPQYLGKPFADVDPLEGLEGRRRGNSQYRWTLLAGKRGLSSF